MRHGKKLKKIGRSAPLRKATLVSLSTALIRHKRITTTFTKAKALRGFVEPLISRAKSDTVHNRREVFKHLQDKEAVTTLFSDVADKVGDRPGGYTRVVKLGRRQGDGAEVAMIELVDYNDIKPDGSGGSKKRRTRRGRRRKTGAEPAVEATAAAAVTSADEAEVDESAEAAAAVDVSSADDVAVDEAVEDAAAIASVETADNAVTGEEEVDEGEGPNGQEAHDASVENEVVEETVVSEEPAEEPAVEESIENVEVPASAEAGTTEEAEETEESAEEAPEGKAELEQAQTEEREAEAEGEDAGDTGSDEDEDAKRD
jgi:large subunit ribosomal protein L17